MFDLTCIVVSTCINPYTLSSKPNEGASSMTPVLVAQLLGRLEDEGRNALHHGLD